ncbi:hypothetical protein [Novosphingobium pentaromativorans]|uniref:hypothetical protein n=1 Tax=Novosphingobium pentaromativorans TaxID=205844 RepID=UPI00110F6D3C|nr:hypothetical protein [Novosphingobium pentaromativorans]
MQKFKIAGTLASSLPAGIGSYIIQRALATSRVFDPLADAIGRRLAVTFSSEAAAWVVALVVFLVFYAFLCWLIWRRPKPDDPEKITQSGPTLGGDHYEQHNVLGPNEMNIDRKV